MAAPEFVREGKIFPFLYSVYEALITERIDFDSVVEMQAHAYAYGRRIDLTGRANRQHWVVRPPDGYYYQLEGIRVFYPEGVASAAPLTAEIVTKQRDRIVVNDPTPIPLFTTPGDQRQKHYMVHTNTLVGANSNLLINLGGNDGTDPAYVDIMTEGLLIPAFGLNAG